MAGSKVAEGLASTGHAGCQLTAKAANRTAASPMALPSRSVLLVKSGFRRRRGMTITLSSGSSFVDLLARNAVPVRRRGGAIALAPLHHELRRLVLAAQAQRRLKALLRGRPVAGEIGVESGLIGGDRLVERRRPHRHAMLEHLEDVGRPRLAAHADALDAPHFLCSRQPPARLGAEQDVGAVEPSQAL